uniref:Uncharacterized protein n=1 Tax=Caenorhabditis japonica TaxID=281687 RepID=A0A8R1IY94_CAEJA
MARLALDFLFFRRFWRLLKMLFPFHRRSITVWLAVALLVTTIIDQVMTYLVGIQPSLFYVALGNRDWDNFKILCARGAAIIIGKAFTLALARYLTNMLAIKSRQVCNLTMHRLYFKRQAFYLLDSSGDVLDNPERVIRKIGSTVFEQTEGYFEFHLFSLQGPFEAARRLLDSRTTLMEKQEMFFVDYGIMPLFVQENYLNMKNDKHSKLESIRGIRRAAEYISLGDLVDRQVRAGGAWKLLNEQSMLSAALPAMATDGHLKAMIQFPSWLGKNSTAGKRKRLLQQLVQHTHLRVSADTQSFATDYAPMIRQKITKPLLELESDGIPQVIDTMTEYDLIKDDAEALTEIVVWPGKIDPASKILTKVKSALTRTLNKTNRMLPYSLDDVSKGRRRGVNSIGIVMDEEGNLVEQFEEEEGESDGEEAPKTSTEVVVKSRSGSSATTSKTRGGGARGGGARGRGRGAKK